jgi:hypothetical protein
MKENKIITPLIETLVKDFSIDSSALAVQADLAAVKEHLKNRITELMSRNYDRFLNSLYRIDVDESKVREILHSKDKISIPEKLADLIIERQMMRIKTKLLYKMGKL